ncbi:MAG: succinyl-diaminopimelate desuccinylase [Gaiellaceae bacterium]|jgi:acetylornithine deacetylase|nr:succinyl-diaminopimelate desuccinylase [Gaiellaceae bacterium]
MAASKSAPERWPADRGRVAQIASELVAITSVNPALGGSDGGEARVAERIGALCSAIGCEVDFEEVLPARPNVIASLHRDDSYPTLVIEGHTDTVAAPSVELLTPRIDGGRLVGRGACDTKGGIAAALHALERLAAIDIRLNVRFVGTIDEEVAFRGVTHYLRYHPHADAAIVIEPTLLVPVVAHGGVMRGELRAEGRAVHSATPELGENAITALAEAIPGVASWAEQREPHEHELCGRTSFSVTTIRGGTGINTIPAECVAEFDWRLHPSDDAETARAALVAHLAESTPHVSLATVFLLDGGLDLDVGEPLVAAARAACARITGNTEVAGLRANTDASKFARAGIPAIVLGPGSLAQAHTAEEWIEIEELARAAELYVALCLGFAGAR